MAKNTGIPYEKLTQSIFNQILNEKRVKTITVEHDVELKGITTKHKIDVYWEFEEAGIKYRTIVQCKDWANPVKQEQLLALKSVLTDLPGQPRGVFVTLTGYQSGARKFAEENGILLYELREPTAEDMRDWMKIFNIKIDMFTPHFENIKLEGDDEWITSESRRLGILEATDIRICRSDSTKLYDDTGNVTTDLQNLLTSLVPKGFEELQTTNITREFDEPTFIETEDARVPKMKIKAIKVSISKILTTMEYQLVGEPFVGYILKNVIEGTERKLQKDS